MTAMTYLSLILAAGLILAMYRDRKRTRSHCTRLIRRTRRQRDAYASCLETTANEYEELELAFKELWDETAVYRREEAGREAAVRERRQRLN